MDYYKLLEITRTASEDEIREAIKKQRRNWNQRANSPKAEIRAQAEKNVAQIREAEKILLDSAKRASYDRELVNQPVQQAPATPEPVSVKRDWLEIAIEHFLNDNYNAMNYAAREATTQQPNNADAWYWRGVSSARLGNRRDADYELHEAIRINPSDPSYYAELGDLYCFADLDQEAVKYYRQAIKLDGSVQHFQVALARSLLALNQYNEALKVVEAAYRLDKDDDFCKYFYTLAIREVIVHSWSIYPDDMYRITNAAQMEFSKKMLALIDTIRCTDADMIKDINEIKDLVAEAETVKMNKPQHLGRYIVIWIISLCLIPLSGIGLIPLAISIAVFVVSNRVPGWKWNFKHSTPQQRGTGIQA